MYPDFGRTKIDTISDRHWEVRLTSQVSGDWPPVASIGLMQFTIHGDRVFSLFSHFSLMFPCCER